MPQHSTTTELRKQSPEDLKRDIAAKRLSVAKLRMGLQMQKEKNAGAYRAQKRELARMLTVAHEQKKTAEQLPSKAKTPNLPARSSKRASSTTQS